MSLPRNKYALLHPNTSKRPKRTGNSDGGKIFYFSETGFFSFYHKNAAH